MRYKSIQNVLNLIRQGMPVDPIYNFEIKGWQIAILIATKILSYTLYAVGVYYLCKLMFG
jgi:hypothetical protein